VGGSTYTFRATSAGVTAAGDVLIGATTNLTLGNLANAINDTGGTNNNSGTGTYYATAANTGAAATAPAGTTLTLTALSATAATGDAIVLTAPTNAGGGITVSGSGTLAGGVNTSSVVTAVTNTLLSSAGANPGSNAQATLALINSAIASVASLRGTIGANINRLQAASNVESVQVQNLTAAEDQITAANIPQQVTNLSEYSILNQSGISALAQANSAQQSILKLLQ
jgi:flagellin